MEVKEFIAKLDKANFTSSPNSKTIVGDILGNEIKVSYMAKLMTNVHDLDKTPLQMVIRVEINGHYAMSYGAYDQESNTSLATFFVTKYNQAMAEEMRIEDVDKAKAKAIFEAI